MSRYCIAAEYVTGAQGFVDFPEGKTWDDVRAWHIRWDYLHVRFTDGSQGEFALNSDSTDSTDWKLPIHAIVHPVIDGVVDHDTEVAEE